MTYLKILSYARKGIAYERARYVEMQNAAIKRADSVMEKACQAEINALEVDAATLDEIEAIHNRKE